MCLGFLKYFFSSSPCLYDYDLKFKAFLWAKGYTEGWGGDKSMFPQLTIRKAKLLPKWK